DCSGGLLFRSGRLWRHVGSPLSTSEALRAGCTRSACNATPPVLLAKVRHEASVPRGIRERQDLRPVRPPILCLGLVECSIEEGLMIVDTGKISPCPVQPHRCWRFILPLIGTAIGRLP